MVMSIIMSVTTATTTTTATSIDICFITISNAILIAATVAGR